MAENHEVESWEDLDVNDDLQNKINSKPPNQNSVNEQSKKESTKPTILREDTERTHYTPPVRILRRSPEERPKNENNVTQNTPATWKSVEQRELEYKEARLRIFGSEENEKSDSTSGDEKPNVNR